MAVKTLTILSDAAVVILIIQVRASALRPALLVIVTEPIISGSKAQTLLATVVSAFWTTWMKVRSLAFFNVTPRLRKI